MRSSVDIPQPDGRTPRTRIPTRERSDSIAGRPKSRATVGHGLGEAQASPAFGPRRGGWEIADGSPLARRAVARTRNVGITPVRRSRSSPITGVRGVITVFAWLGLNIRAVRPDRLD